MIKNIFYFFIFSIIICSCDKSDSKPLLGGGVFVLLNSDSSSVIVSSLDTIIINHTFIRDDIVKHSNLDVTIEAHQKDYYDSVASKWSVNDSIYTINIGYIDSDSIFIEFREQVDTLVQLQAPLWWLDPLNIIFNGKVIYIPQYRGEIIPLVR